jgi:hypothetical protein
MINQELEKTTDAGIKAQVKRLAAYYGYEEFKHELVRVLKSRARSNEHVERIVTHILDTRRPNEHGFSSCPTPAEMIDYVAHVAPSLNQLRNPDKNCSICCGSGWRITERQRLSGAERCQCANP